MSPRKTPARKQGWFRPKGFLVPICMFAAVYFYVQFVADFHLRSVIENYASAVNGAQVSIGTFRTHILSGKIEMRDVQVAQHTQPTRNLLELESVDIQFLWVPLLAGKFISPKVIVKGVRLLTARDNFGGLTYNMEGPALPPGLLDRAASGMYESIRKEIGDTPLRKLGMLSAGLGTQNRVEQLRNELVTTRKLQEYEKEVEFQTVTWEKAASIFQLSQSLEEAREALTNPALRKTASQRPLTPSQILKAIRQERSKAAEAMQEIDQQANALKTSLSSLDSYINRDVIYVRDSLGLPRLNGSDFTHALLGPKLLNVLERAGYWVDVSRRRMPTGPEEDKEIVVVTRNADIGTDVVFGKRSTYPRFLIMHAEIHSEAGENPNQGSVRAELNDLTSDPPIWRKPTTLEVAADFPGISIRNFKLKASVDHTRELPEEQINLAVDSFPLTDWVLENSSDLRLRVTKADAKIAFDGSFRKNEALTQWSIFATQVEYGIDTRFKTMQDALKDAFVPFSSLYASGTVRGMTGDMKLELTSNVGKKLGSVLNEKFKHSLAAVDDTIRQNILDRVESPRRRLREQLTESLSRVNERYASYTQSLNEFEQKLR